MPIRPLVSGSGYPHLRYITMVRTIILFPVQGSFKGILLQILYMFSPTRQSSAKAVRIHSPAHKHGSLIRTFILLMIYTKHIFNKMPLNLNQYEQVYNYIFVYMWVFFSKSVLSSFCMININVKCYSDQHMVSIKVIINNTNIHSHIHSIHQL